MTIYNICPHPGRRGGILPHTDPSSTGFYELPSPYTCSSSCCWFWPAWCLCLKRTTAVHCPTTSPAPSTPCYVTPTALHPHENCHDTQRWSPSPSWRTEKLEIEIQNGFLNSVRVQVLRHLLPSTTQKHHPSSLKASSYVFFDYILSAYLKCIYCLWSSTV